MARTAEALKDRLDERPLIEFARENSPGKFHFFCRHARHAADPDEYAAEEADQVQERRLSLSTWIDGSMGLSGVLDAFGGGPPRAGPRPPPPPAGGNRPPGPAQPAGDPPRGRAAGRTA